MHARRQMLKQKAQGLIDGFCFDRVVIVKHQNHLFWARRQVINEQREQRVTGWQGRGLQQGQHLCAQVWLDGLQCGNNIAQETGEIIVVLIEREPGRREVQLREPIAEQRGFAKASRSGDQGHSAGQARMQSLNQVWARNEAGPTPGRTVGARSGDIEFGLQQGCVHTVEDTPLTSE